MEKQAPDAEKQLPDHGELPNHDPTPLFFLNWESGAAPPFNKWEMRSLKRCDTRFRVTLKICLSRFNMYRECNYLYKCIFPIGCGLNCTGDRTPIPPLLQIYIHVQHVPSLFSGDIEERRPS